MPATKGRAALATRPTGVAKVSKTTFLKAQEKSRAALKRLRDAKLEDADRDLMVAGGVGLATGLLERSGRKLPTVMGIDPLLLYPVLGYAALRKQRGKAMSTTRDALVMALAIGVNKATVRGSAKVGEEPDAESESEDESGL